MTTFKYTFLGPGESYPDKDVKYILQTTDGKNYPQNLPNWSNMLKATVTGTATLQTKINDANLGSYEISFFPTQLGKYEIEVFINNKSTFKKSMRVIPQGGEPKPVPVKVTCERIVVCKEGSRAYFIIKVKDKRTLDAMDVQAGELQVTLDGPTNLNCKLSPLSGKGEFKVSYQGSRIGQYQLGIVYKGQNVLKEETLITVAGVASPATTVANMKGDPKVGKKLTILIDAKDSSGNKCTAGGDNFDVEVAGPVLTEPELLDFNNGRYRVDVMLPKKGRYEVDIKIGDTHISNSPVKFRAEE